MDYTKLNAEFVEKFGELEKLCSDIYSQKHGVSCYIDDMLSKNGERVVINWDYYEKRLKDIRYKRNKLTHGEVGFSENFAQKEDISFISDFINLIFKSEDPLSIYNKKMAKGSTKKTTEQPEIVYKYSQSQDANNSSASSVLTVTLVIVIICIIGCILYNILN